MPPQSSCGGYTGTSAPINAMRTILISILVALILLLGGAWAYLLLNGSPESVADLRQNLFGGSDPIVSTPTPTPIIASESTETRTIALGVPLLKVSDRAVAGAVIAPVASSTVLRYVEKGTGHIYEVSLETGVETRISNTTIPGAVRAIWAPSGRKTIIETDTLGARGSIYLGTLGTSTAGVIVDLEGLTDALDNVAFSNTDTLFYTTIVSGETVGFARDLTQGSTVELFRVPFTESIVLWDIAGGGRHYAYTKPAFGFSGFLYEVGSIQLRKVDAGIGLVAARLGNVLLISKNRAQGTPTLMLNEVSGLGTFTSIPGSREKCAGSTVIYCGGSDQVGVDFPVFWYQGTVSYDDTIYRIDPRDGAVTLELDPETIAREPLDVTDIFVGPDGRVLFRNKVDDALWLLNPSDSF